MRGVYRGERKSFDEYSFRQKNCVSGYMAPRRLSRSVIILEMVKPGHHLWRIGTCKLMSIIRHSKAETVIWGVRHSGGVRTLQGGAAAYDETIYWNEHLTTGSSYEFHQPHQPTETNKSDGNHSIALSWAFSTRDKLLLNTAYVAPENSWKT